MDRRTFLKAAAMVSPGLESFSYREERMPITIGNQVEAHVIASAHSGEKSAEHFRRAWIGQPFEGLGEFYRDSTEIRRLPDLPTNLICTYSFHHTTIGVAAQKRNYLVGAFRRKNIAVIVRIIGDHEVTMTSIADHLADQEIPTVFEVLWNPIHLRKFIPSANDVGRSVEQSETYWP